MLRVQIDHSHKAVYKQSLSLPHIPQIDGLRAIAVLAVVLYHADIPGFSGGFVGVDIFFVLSGYLITSLLRREFEAHGRIDIWSFYARRVRRILPAQLVLLAVVMMAALLFLSPIDGSQQGVARSAIATSVFLANHYFKSTLGEYFSVLAEEAPLLHMWSLAVEEQYYFVWPLLLLVLLRKFRVGTIPLIWLLAGVSLAAAEWTVRMAPTSAFYTMPFRFWELAAGGLVALSPTPEWVRKHASPVLSMCLGIVALSIISMHLAPFFPGISATLPVLGTAFAILAIHSGGLGNRSLAGAVLSWSPIRGVGLISYSLYLWHWPLLAFAKATSVMPPSMSVNLGLCAMAVVISILSYLFVEQPFRSSAAQPRLTVGVGAAAIGVIVLSAASIGLRARYLDLSDDPIWRASRDLPTGGEACHYTVTDVPGTLPGVLCSSDPQKPIKTVVWGDSHALAWKPFVWQIAANEGSSAIGFTFDSCPPALGYISSRVNYPEHQGRCDDFNRRSLDWILANRPHRVVLAGRWLRDSVPGPTSYFEPPVATRGAAAMRRDLSLKLGLADVVDRIAGSVDEVILMMPPPQLRHTAIRCLLHEEVEACAMPITEYRMVKQPWVNLFSEIALTHPNVTVIDPEAFFCNANACPVMHDGMVLFWDDDHPSSTAARALAAAYIANPDRYKIRGKARPMIGAGDPILFGGGHGTWQPGRRSQ